MYLILDLHAAPGGQGNDIAISDRDTTKPSLWQSRENELKTIALWRKLAESYAGEKWMGAYDIINEPNWGFQNATDKNGCAETGNEPLKKLMVDITAAIREVDKNHIIIIEGNCWGNNYKGILPTWDDNTVVSFHKYWNDNTTGIHSTVSRYPGSIQCAYLVRRNRRKFKCMVPQCHCINGSNIKLAGHGGRLKNWA